jgi:hypothetical protein
MGLVPIFAIYKTNHHSSEIVLWKNKFYIFWIVIWILFASFRYIGDGIGGTDAENYLTFFFCVVIAVLIFVNSIYIYLCK